MMNEKPLFVVKQPVFLIVCFGGFIGFFGICAIGLASQNNAYSKQFFIVTVVFTILMLISMTFNIKVYENRLVQRFLFMDIVSLSVDEIHSAAFTLGRFGDEMFDIYSEKRRIRIFYYSWNIVLLVGWLEEHKVKIS